MKVWLFNPYLVSCDILLVLYGKLFIFKDCQLDILQKSNWWQDFIKEKGQKMDLPVISKLKWRPLNQQSLLNGFLLYVVTYLRLEERYITVTDLAGWSSVTQASEVVWGMKVEFSREENAELSLKPWFWKVMLKLGRRSSFTFWFSSWGSPENLGARAVSEAEGR